MSFCRACAAGGHSGVTALSIAASTGDEALVRALLDAKACVDLVDERGCPPVMTAARQGFAEACS
eukprot:2608612-Amphidinium_carterae.1